MCVSVTGHFLLMNKPSIDFTAEGKKKKTPQLKYANMHYMLTAPIGDI